MTVDKTKVALFGGTFDPIHYGHINLAIEMLENYSLNKIFFCPNYQNPLKARTGTPEFHRLEMLRLALVDIPEFEIIDWEIERKEPSYTIDTLRRLTKQYPNPYLIMGEDSINSFKNWKDWEEIQALATILSGARTGDSGKKENRIIEISSTELRDRIAKGLYCGHLMPKNVLDYIHTHQLYSVANYE